MKLRCAHDVRDLDQPGRPHRLRVDLLMKLTQPEAEAVCHRPHILCRGVRRYPGIARREGVRADQRPPPVVLGGRGVTVAVGNDRHHQARCVQVPHRSCAGGVDRSHRDTRCDAAGAGLHRGGADMDELKLGDGVGYGDGTEAGGGSGAGDESEAGYGDGDGSGDGSGA